MRRSSTFVAIALLVLAWQTHAVHHALARGPAPKPSDAAYAAALATIKAFHKAQYADKTVEAKRGLAKTLLTSGVELHDDPIGRYVLFDQARALSIQAADVDRTLAAIDRLVEGYELDERAMRAEAITQLASKPESAVAPLASAAFDLIQQFMSADDLPGANKLAKAIEAKLEGSGADALIARLRIVRENLTQKTNVAGWKKSLAANANDPGANHNLGLHYCFTEENFDLGLPLLTKSSDLALNGLARTEIAKPQTPDAQFDLAEGWFEFAKKRPVGAQLPVMAHAAHWFRTAQIGLTGLKRQQAVKRLTEIGAWGESAPDPARPQEAAAARTKALPKYAKRKKAGDIVAVKQALDWLRRHQSPNGFWSPAAFSQLCKGNACDGPGEQTHCIGVTALAMLAFLGAGNTTTDGDHKEAVGKAYDYLRGTQDAATGAFGDPKSTTAWIYDHAIATYATVELIGMQGGSPELMESAQRAVNFILSAQNPSKGWRYRVPGNGENDVSITGWMVAVLYSAREVGLIVDEKAFDGAKQLIDEMTDPVGGRTGYVSRGSFGAREPGTEKRWPVNVVEPMTASGIFARILMGLEPQGTPQLRLGADLLRKALPRWDEQAGTIDYYYWYCGTNAMYQMGGRDWSDWNAHLTKAITKSQVGSGCERGSWKPQFDPWGHRGGRVYATALLCLCAEAEYRSARVMK